jgi:hypothetical protein
MLKSALNSLVKTNHFGLARPGITVILGGQPADKAVVKAGGT